MTIKVPFGYHLVHFRDCIIALPEFPPAYEPKIYNFKTRRWNKIRHNLQNDRLNQARQFVMDCHNYANTKTLLPLPNEA